MKKIIFTGGGTLGHVMPNLYLMEELEEYEISYIGSNGIEKEKVKGKVKNYFEIPVVKLVRGKFFCNFKIPFVLVSSIIKAKKILKKERPDVIFSKGGYVSLPVCVAAKMLKIPIIAHESDYSLGLANKIILKFSDKMFVNFKNLEDKNNKITYSGPIFSKRFEASSKNKFGLNLDANKPTVLIVGGSLGSQKINDNIYPIIKDLLKDFNIIHITGKGNLKIKSHGNYNAFEMRNDMVNLYNIADFVIGRSGAGVTAECYYKRLPMLLIPLGSATRGDQMLNAKYYEDLGVAKVLEEMILTPTKLLEEVKDLYANITKYQTKYKSESNINGKDKVLKLIREYAEKNTNLT